VQLFQYVRYAGDEDCFCADAVIEIVGYAVKPECVALSAPYFFSSYVRNVGGRVAVLRARQS
jgi:hypothetical protein